MSFSHYIRDDQVPASFALCCDHEQMLEPLPIERPALTVTVGSLRIRTPRSAKRVYSETEIFVAAGLLEKLRRREERLPEATLDARRLDNEQALDVVADRLLDLL